MKKIYILSLAILYSIAAIAQLEFTTIDATVTEDFNTYKADGFTTSPAAGQLHSDNWSIIGFSDGDMNFGDTKTSGDFTGSQTLTTGTGGLNPYQDSFDSGDVNFGISVTGTDFSPGELIFRIKNNTGKVVTSVDVTYNFEFLNNNPRSHTFNFSHSINNSSYTAVASLDDATPSTADGAAFWKQNKKTTTISGLSLACGDYLYIKWTSDFTGPNASDEIGLDDLTLTPHGTVASTCTAPTNKAPTANDFSTTATENVLKSINVISTNASDSDGDALKINIVTGPTNGTATVNGNSIDYTSTLAGTYTIVYNVEETTTAPALKSADKTITITVTSAPVGGSVPAAGDIIITEFASAGAGEWVEIYNTTSSAIDLTDISVTEIKTGTTSTLSTLQDLGTGSIGAGEYLIIIDNSAGDETDFKTRWPSADFSKAIVVTTFGLTDGADEIILVHGTSTVIDSIGWTNKTEFTNGSVQGSTTAETASRNGLTGNSDDVANWALASSGTPGAANVPLANTAPTANDFTANVTINSSNSITVIPTNATDANSDALEVKIITPPTNGTAVVNGNSIDYTPTLAGSYTIGYQVCETATTDKFCSATKTISVTAAVATSTMFDDFNDNDITKNPVWGGETSKFTVTLGELQSNVVGATGTDEIYISSPSTGIDNTTWEFLVREEKSTSDNNRVDVYLTSDNSDLKGNVNGYFVRFGKSDDDISLWRKMFVGGKDSLVEIIPGITKSIELIRTNVGIKVTRDDKGNWELFQDIAGGTAYSSVGTVNDNVLTTSTHFGILVGYTKTQSTLKFIDEIKITTVTPVVNTAPVNKNFTGTATENILTSLVVLPTNATDAEADNLAITVVSSSNGTAKVNGNNIDYTPTTAGVQTITYKVCETTTADLFCSGDSIITVTVSAAGVNTAPINKNFTGTATENILSSIAVLPTNATDAEGDNLALTVVSTSNGIAKVNGNNIDYTPTTSGVQTITYKVCETATTDKFCSGDSTITVTVSATLVNTKPTAIDFNDTVVLNTLKSIIVIPTNGSDTEGDALEIKFPGPVDPSVTRTANGNNIDFTGTKVGSFGVLYQVCETGTADKFCSAAQVLTVEVKSGVPNTAPVAKDFSITLTENVQKFITIIGSSNASDLNDDELKIKVINQPTNGGAVASGNSIVYRAGTPGTYTIGYQVCETKTTDTLCSVTQNITVTSVAKPTTNSAPAGTVPLTTTTSGVKVIIDIASHIIDPDGDPINTGFQTKTFNGTAVVVGTNIEFTPDINFVGTVMVNYRVCDPSELCAIAIAGVKVEAPKVGPNNGPVANDFTATTTETTLVNLDVVSNSSDADGDELTTTIFTQPKNGVAAINGKNIDYTPNTGFTGDDTLTYEVCDPSLDCANGQIIITVNANTGNQKPTANNGTLVIDEGKAGTVDVTTIATDPEAGQLTVTVLVQPDSGTVIVTGTSIEYTPNPEFLGNDTINYTVCDPATECANASVFVTVTPVDISGNQKPTASDINVSVDENSVKSIDVSSSTNDLDNDLLTLSVTVQPNQGVATVNGSTISYTPAKGFTGSDKLTYKVCDPSNACATASMFFTVQVSCTSNLLSGTVSFNDFGVEAKDIQLIKALGNDKFDLDPLNIYHASSTSNGSFVFKGVNPGDYLLKAKNAGIYPATYKGKTISWQTADIVTVGTGCTSQTNLNIDIVEDFAVGKGNTELNGVIYSSTTLGGAAMDNADVYVRLPSSGNIIIGQKTTVANGSYNFDELLDGNRKYTVYVDVPGYNSDLTELTINPNTIEITKADFCTSTLDSIKTCSGTALALDELDEFVTGINVYPNPTANELYVDYSLLENSDVNLSIIGVLGNRLTELTYPNQLSGNHTIDLSHIIKSTGVYFVNIKVNHKNYGVRVVKID